MIKKIKLLKPVFGIVLDAGVIICICAVWYIRFQGGLFDLDPWYLSLRSI